MAITIGLLIALPILGSLVAFMWYMNRSRYDATNKVKSIRNILGKLSRR